MTEAVNAAVPDHLRLTRLSDHRITVGTKLQIRELGDEILVVESVVTTSQIDGKSWVRLTGATASKCYTVAELQELLFWNRAVCLDEARTLPYAVGDFYRSPDGDRSLFILGCHLDGQMIVFTIQLDYGNGCSATEGKVSKIIHRRSMTKCQPPDQQAYDLLPSVGI